MKTMNSKKFFTATLLLVFCVLTSALYAQEHYSQQAPTSITIAGTSTIHDWTMISNNVTCKAEFDINANGDIVNLKALQVTLPAESLKSGKSGMDKNAYSALKTDKHKQIAFELVAAGISNQTIHTQGKLKIAGVEKPVEVEATYTMLSGGRLQAKGSLKLLMTDYGVEPPTFMFGSVTTGNELTISFTVTLVPSAAQAVTLK